MTLLAIGQSQGQKIDSVSLIILGNVQDGGSPHIGCQKSCCTQLFEHPDPSRLVSSLGVVDHSAKKSFLFDATPDLPQQLKVLKGHANSSKEIPDAIFLTHAHMGHYTGLMYLGREALGSSEVPVFAMPRMKHFLATNGPWNQLMDLRNIKITPILHDRPVDITSNITVIPFLVPHRDEFSETVGYTIIGPQKTALFIPDIDKWQKWKRPIIEEIKKVDYAFLDATFYDGNEINNRDIGEIPHPFVIESLEMFSSLLPEDKAKVHFIHLNHTNPLLQKSSEATRHVEALGFNIARFEQTFQL